MYKLMRNALPVVALLVIAGFTAFAPPAQAQTTVTIDFDAGSGNPVSYTESGMTVTALSGNLGFFGGFLIIDAPRTFEFDFGGTSFTVLSVDFNLQEGIIFTSSDGAVEEICLSPSCGQISGTHVFPAAGWTSITFFTLNMPSGETVAFIDNLVVELEPADTDGDGVPDATDLCPVTPAGATVDANGCSQAQVDQDLDGICDPGKTSTLCTGSDVCPTEDATGFDANSDGCIDTPEGLMQIIETLPAETLSAELKTGLVSKVENAQKSGDKDNICAGVNQLQAFINQIDAQRGKKVSDEAADELIAFAESAILALKSQLPAGETCK